MKVTINSNIKDIKNFVQLIPGRKQRFEMGSETPLPKTYRVNETAKALHPKEQKLAVTEIESFGADVKCYTLSPVDGSKPAYFRAGQYLSLRLEIGESYVTRPYSIASSPRYALEDGKYKIAVKRVDDGFVSGYILDNFEIGTNVTASEPLGNFCYEPLRDANTVVGIAGGSGITPFLSLAQAIADGTEDAQLVLLYGARTKKDLLFTSELNALQKECEKIKVVYVLSESKAKGFELGFITKELIEKYAPEQYSVFLCGPQAMYDFVSGEIDKIGIRSKFVRFEMFGSPKNPSKLPGYPEQSAGKVFSCTVMRRGESLGTFSCNADESLLVALERSGIAIPTACRSGECGFCRCKLVDGEVFIPDKTEHRREGDIRFGFIHPCCTYPLSDVILSV